MARSAWIEDLEWVRPGQQTRSQQTQARLLDAAAELYAEKGIAATNVADIAAHAGCTTGAVYHHFRDKQALLYALLQRMSEEYRATMAVALDPARWEGATVRDLLRAFLEFSLELGRDRPLSKRAAVEVARDDPGFREHLAELRSEINEGLLALLLARRQEIRHPQPETAAKFALDLLGSLLATRLDELLLPTYLANRPDEAFVDEALEVAAGYLQLD